MTEDLWVDGPDDLARVPKVKKPPARRRSDRFIGCPISWLKRVRPTVRSAEQLVVALYIYRLTVVRRSKTVRVSNAELQREFGIERRVKYRTLSCLERAGLIRIEGKTGRATVVTLLK
jgi:hypothetical protein